MISSMWPRESPRVFSTLEPVTFSDEIKRDVLRTSDVGCTVAIEDTPVSVTHGCVLLTATSDGRLGCGVQKTERDEGMPNGRPPGPRRSMLSPPVRGAGFLPAAGP